MTHAPKIAALLAYEAKILSTKGTRRVEAHLASCDECRRALAAIRAYDALVEDARAESRTASTPEPSYDRMTLALRREARAVAARVRPPEKMLPAIAYAVAAAALIGIAVVAGTRDTAPAVAAGEAGERSADPAAAGDEREPIAGEITLTAGTVSATGLEIVSLGSQLADDAELTTGEHSEAHVRFASGTGAAVLADSNVRLARLRRGQVTLELERGGVASEVAHLAAGDAYEVHAGAWTARVRGTHFQVTRIGDDIEVRVVEGVVEVLRADVLEAVVFAPGVFRSSLGVWTGDVVAGVHLEREGEPVTIRADADVDMWNVAGLSLPAQSDIQMRVPTGELSLRGYGSGRELFARLVPVPIGGAVVEGQALAPSAPPVAVGRLAPELIAPTIRAGMRGLISCHEQIARLSEAPSGRFTLRVTIGRTGDVQRAQLLHDGDPPPPGLAACIIEKTRNWTFPAPTGGVVTFEQPLNFASRMR